MRKKEAPSLEKNLDDLGDVLLVVGGAALGTYFVKKFMSWNERRNPVNESPTYYLGFGDADLGLMPANTYHHRK